MSEFAAAPMTPRSVTRLPLGIAKSLLVLLVFYIGVTLYYVGEYIVTRHFGAKVPPINSLLFSLVVGWPIALFVAARLSSRSIRDCFRSSPVPLRIWGALTLTIIGMIPTLVSLTMLIPMPTMIRQAFEQATSGSRLVAFLAIVVVAPLTEEALFRGIFLRNFLERYPPTKAIWATAILFALFHANPWQAVAALPLGLLFAWVVVETRALWTSVFAHVLSNFVAAFVMVWLFQWLGYSDAQMRAMRFYPASVFIVSVVIMGIGLILLVRAIRQNRSTNPQALAATA